jgi:hypothetical protein
MAIVTKETVEKAKAMNLIFIDKDLYANAQALIEIHRIRTGIKPKTTAADQVRLCTFLDSQEPCE